MVDKKPTLSFPKKFLWGAATAAHQVEGGNHNQWSVWEKENAKARAVQAAHHAGDLASWPRIAKEASDPGNYISGPLARHYEFYEHDFDLLQKMNMNAYRFSVEWSRIEPQAGAWNVEAIEHYKQYVRALKKRDIEPIVTLFHFSLPTWFAAMDGFEKRSNVKYFTRFVRKIVSELGIDIRLIITINEPGIYAGESYLRGQWPPALHSRKKTFQVLNNLAYAHNQAAAVIHSLNRRYRVSVSHNSTYFYAGDDAWLSRYTVAVLQNVYDDYFLKRVAKSCDFLGLNFYFSNRVYGYRVHNADITVNDLGWDLSPGDIQFALERLSEKYKLPILITENGLADAEDTHRQWWITETLRGMRAAMDNGVKLEGYLHWSLIDNFEWAEGKWPRFGLAHVDYKTGKRTLRPSAIWFGKVIKHIRSTS